ncbi:Lysine-specific demethylase 4D [Frankliniella fusca]|uniref:Lysine-specific demethylase 4D n=1 Tax=Frankliniella fusca TaxID=407009 RepID=A0AAE1LFI8_9NEOP|nr:Lysine-specific demethylase 4D [Frankliniella fusca]
MTEPSNMPMPSKMYRRFGVDYYEIDEQQFLHPGHLIDMLVNNKTLGSASNVCKTGVFVARLKVPTLSEAYVAEVKNLAARDVEMKDFRPLLLQRRCRWREAGFYQVTTASEGSNKAHERTLRNRREEFRQDFLALDFGNPEKSNLEQVLDAAGVGPCIDEFYARLRKRNSPIMYAANMDLKTLGEDLQVEVNLKITENASMSEMQSLIKYLGEEGDDYPGINRPTVYVGTEASLFQCHREDVSLQAINMHVAGAPKIWFVVPPKYLNAFCKVVEKLGLSAEERQCTSILQHKFFFLDPRVLLQEKIPVHTIIQRPGDIVYLLPNAVHFGFNVGWNVNEAVNCCSKTYCLPGMLAPQRCNCPDVAAIRHDFDIKRILRKADVSDDMVRLYANAQLLTISSELRLLHPDLHPEMGLPGDSSLRIDHLLGEDVGEEEVGKLWMTLRRAGEADAEYIGGFQEIELDGEEVAVRPKGTHRCPECHHDTKRGGPKAGREAVESHVRQKHTAKFVEIMSEYERMYSPKRTRLDAQFQCGVCEKYYATQSSLNRHVRSSAACRPEAE